VAAVEVDALSEAVAAIARQAVERTTAAGGQQQQKGGENRERKQGRPMFA
jgi:hypothetical protein